MNKRSRKAVAPVLATLLMIAVAVAMSVIIFMWSQNFLSQTSESTGSQQGSQNQAAQSSISIENTLFNTLGNGTKEATVYIRNVGAVSVNPAMGVASGISSNAGFKSQVTNATSSTNSPLAKGAGSSMKFHLTGLISGDTVTFKVTTVVGTFAQATYTVP